MKNYDVSVIVPIFRIDDELLKNCVQSLVKQTSMGFSYEVILVDDGSTKENARICDDFAFKYEYIKVIHSVNRGVSVARNIGLDNSNGEYVCFVDPDDCLRENFLAEAYRIASESKIEILLFRFITSKDLESGFSWINEKQKECVKRDLNEDELQAMFSKIVSISSDEYNSGACWGKLIKRNFIEKNNLRFVSGVKKAQDRIFMLDCLACNPIASTYDAVGYVYTIANGFSICHKYNPEIVDILEYTQKEIKKRVERYGEKYKSAFYTMNMMFFFEYMQLYFANKENHKTEKQRIGDMKSILSTEPYKSSLWKVKIFSVRKRCSMMIIFLRLKMYKMAIKLF